MIITYRYRMMPTRRQHRALERILESQRELYNAALLERIEAYRKAGVHRSYFDQCKALTDWRSTDNEAASLPLCVQRATLKRLEEAFRAFFRRLGTGEKPGFPRFRGKGWFDSFGFREFSGISLKGGRLRFKGMPGSLRVHMHRTLPINASIRSCTFSRDSKGWSVSFAVSNEAAEPRRLKRVVGVDLGLSTFAALSNGGFIPSLKAARRAERRLRVAQRALARKKHGSRGRREARTVLARCHETIARRRSDHLHQASARLVRDYDAIVIENLNVKGLAAGLLARDVRDASWGRFISMLRYKAERAGALLVEVDPRNTSQECSGCGAMVQKTLGDRLHDCQLCGLHIERDINAARNILARAGVGPGLHNVAGYGMRADENLGVSQATESGNGCN